MSPPGAKAIVIRNAAPFWLFTVLCVATAIAQPPGTDARKEDETDSAPSDAGLTETIYLLDRDGELVFVPDLRLEELFEIQQRLQSELPARAPNYVVNRVSVTGEANAATAQLTVSYDITMTADADEPTAVRLGLGGGVLQLPADYRGPGEQFISYQSGGYVCWLTGKAESKHKLSLRWTAALGRANNGQQLRIALPRARTEMDVSVLAPQATPSVNDARFRVAGESISATRTRLTGNGLGGDLEIDWRRGAGPVAPAPSFFSATAGVTVDIKNRNEILATAEIEVRSSGQPIESFQVRLPAGMESPRIVGDCEITTTRTETIANQTVNTVRIRMNDPTLRVANVSLSCQLNRNQTQANRPLQVIGFEVLEAEYQLGDITLLAGPEWAVRFSEVENVRRIRNPAEHPRADEVLAKFEIVERPCSLQIAVRKRQSRIQVAPTYYLDVRDDRVQVEVKLRNVVGRQSFDIDLPLGDWTPLQLTPPGLTVDGAMELQGKTLTIPLSRLPAPPNGEVEVRLQAEQMLADMDAPFNIALPRPAASRFSPDVVVEVLPAKLVVSAANNVELTPELEESGEWTELPFDDDAPMSWTNRRQTPLVYRSTATSDMRFSAGRAIRPQTLVTDIRGTLTLAAGQLLIEEQFTIDVQYVPAKSIRLVAPRVALQSERFVIMLDRRVLPTAQLSADDMDDELATLEVVLPQERHGEIELVVRYSLAAPAPGEAAATVDTPLVLTAPAENSQIRSAQFTVNHAPTERLTLPPGSAWTAEGATTANGASQFSIQADEAASQLQFQHQRIEPVVGESVIVKQAYLQTWLTNRRRRDRAAFRVETTNQRLALRLPANVDDNSWRVAVNGQLATDVEIDDQRQVTLTLPSAPPRTVRLIEVWCQSEQRPAVGSMSLDAVTLVDVNRMDLCQWHLVTPGSEHMLASPANLTPELAWRMVGFFWERQATLKQSELEQAIGATQSPAPSASENYYLYSSFAPIQRVQVYTVRRGFVVFFAASVVLGLGLVWLNIKAVRRPSAYFVTAVALGSGAALAPAWGFVVLQASGIALVLLAFGGLMRWGMRREGQGTRMWVGSDGDDDNRRSDSTPSHATTATAPTSPPLASDSNA